MTGQKQQMINIGNQLIAVPVNMPSYPCSIRILPVQRVGGICLYQKRSLIKIPFRWFSGKLTVIQISVKTILSHQFIMVSLLNDRPFVHNKDTVCVADG